MKPPSKLSREIAQLVRQSDKWLALAKLHEGSEAEKWFLKKYEQNTTKHEDKKR